MFARTERLTLRPAWPEDAEAIAAVIGDRNVARMLMRLPHPYRLSDAQAYAAGPRGAAEPSFVVTVHGDGTPVIAGGIAITDHGDGAELAYWLAPRFWGRGYATEAGHAVIDMARHALPIRRLSAWYFLDNPASGRVLRKLGFRDTGRREPRTSLARRGPAPVAVMELDLGSDRDLSIAA